MAIYFGTDGIRGIANDSLDHELAFKCGNALTTLKEKPTVVVCKDTRVSGDMILYSLDAGIMCGGGKVINCGILPTAGLAYITRLYGADFGVVISASHNPFEYNGIKVFSSRGVKLCDEAEEKLEELFEKTNLKKGMDIGTAAVYDDEAYAQYKEYLVSCCKHSLKGLKVVLDCARGAAYKVAPDVFRTLGCEVFCFNCDITSGTINDGCGSLYPEVLTEKVKECGADVGFAFDGDSDRVIACDEKGNLVDGDSLIYIFARHMRQQGRLGKDVVVGTQHTNMGIENALLRLGIKLLRADIGDKYVRELMDKEGCLLGGEQSGHIIIGDITTTGDGILSAIEACNATAASGKKLSELSDAVPYPQVNINVPVEDKQKVMSDNRLQKIVKKCREALRGNGRLLVRPSGTEPKVRITVECEDLCDAKKLAGEIADVVRSVSEGN
jgi:phosphoglucosamine mutase